MPKNDEQDRFKLTPKGWCYGIRLLLADGKVKEAEKALIEFECWLDENTVDVEAFLKVSKKMKHKSNV